MDASVLLHMVADRPIVEFADGDLLIGAGQPDPPLFVLAAGTLEVRNRQLALARLDDPGAIVGEIGLLLGTPATADVVAVGPVTVRRIDDAGSLFADHP
ncbi:MAG: cyclic nucleotide-binding domain-containing protein, partial [Ilumatobacteraceae bacterium]